jgi:hypothetical protein
MLDMVLPFYRVLTDALRSSRARLTLLWVSKKSQNLEGKITGAGHDAAGLPTLRLVLAAVRAKIAFLGDPFTTVPAFNIARFSLCRFLLQIGHMPSSKCRKGSIVIKLKISRQEMITERRDIFYYSTQIRLFRENGV